MVIPFTSDLHYYCLTPPGSPVARQHVATVESSSLIRLDNLFYRDDSLTS